MEVKRGLAIGAVVASVVPLMGIAASGYWLYDDIALTSEKLDETASVATSKGVPVIPSDLETTDIKADEDASAALKQMLNVWSQIDETEQRTIQLTMGSFTVPRATLPEGSDSALAAANQLASLAHRAATCKSYSVDKLDAAKEDQLEFRQCIKGVARILCGLASSRAEHGDWNGAFGALHTALRLGRFLSVNDGLEGASGQATITALALDRAVKLLVDNMDSAECRAEYKSLVSSMGFAVDLRGVIERDALLANTVFRGVDNLTYGGVAVKLTDKTFLRANTTRMLEFWVDAYDRVESVFPDEVEMYRAFESTGKDFCAKKSPSRVLAQSAVQQQSQLFGQVVSAGTKLKLAQVVSKIVDARVRSKAWPTGLDGLGANIQDPWSGGVFVYHATSEGFKVFSVGPDGVDNNGSGDDVVIAHGTVDKPEPEPESEA